MGKFKDLTGRQIGNWLVVECIGVFGKHKKRFWLCKCVCGKEMKITTGTLISRPNSKGCKFCYLQMLKDRKGAEHPSWKGGRRIDSSTGYVILNIDGITRREHSLVAEKALGRRLKNGEDVHHVNGNKQDNRNCNLLICSRSYHRWLESKMADLYKKEHFN